MSSLCSSDPYRRVHSHPSLSSTAVPWVCRRGRRGLESWSANGRLPYRGVYRTASWNLCSVLPSLSLLQVSLEVSSLLNVSLYLSVYCFFLFSRWMVRMWLRWDTGRWSIWSGKAATASWSRLSWLPGTLIWRKGSERKVRDTNSHSRDNSEALHDDHHLSLSLHTVPHQSKRLSTPAIALRSKSMTSELEEMGKMWEMRGQKNGGKTSAVFPNLFWPLQPPHYGSITP